MSIVLLVDSINGYFKLNNSSFTFPISQIYKTGILLLILLRLHRKAFFLFIIACTFSILFLPTILQFVQGYSVSIYSDSLKIVKYLTPIICFVYFRELFLQNRIWTIKKLFFFIRISYIIIVVNVLMKFVGLGFSLYRSGIGSKGYIYAGNEISTVFLILYAVLAFELIAKGKKIRFWVFFAFTINVAFVLGSKSAILGVLLVALLLRVRPLAILASSKKLGNFMVVSAVVIPLGIFWFLNRVVSSELFQNRILYYYNKVDLLTLILSSRNLYFQTAFDIYKNNYNTLEKLIGIGQSRYEEITGHTIEMDFLDIFFAYGVTGIFLFLGTILLACYLFYKRKDNVNYPFARLSYLFFILLVIISSLAGHVFSSGIAGIFIGFVFAMTYLRRVV
ncbi:O-antigen ligase family protein [Flagellimonas maritima]|nr:O-antigen ligase family protein [Allomuricauda aurantiaca]